jgi:hypothetical protein
VEKSTLGADVYYHFVPYHKDVEVALQRLRQQEFEAGRYNGALPRLRLHSETSDGKMFGGHRTIDEAREAGGDSGTGSILDIDHLADEPAYCAAAPVPESTLRRLYGTTKPTHAMLQVQMDFIDDLDRGQCLYTVAFKNGKPDEILFVGLTFD